MSLFQCESCGCCENTALSNYHTRGTKIWPGKYRDKKLCSACGPPEYSDGGKTKYGKWHGRFARTFLPKGEFKTNMVGNLEHIGTGSEQYHKYELEREEGATDCD